MTDSCMTDMTWWQISRWLYNKTTCPTSQENSSLCGSSTHLPRKGPNLVPSATCKTRSTPPSPCTLPYRQPGPGPPARSYLYTGRRPPQAPQAPQASVPPGQGAPLPGLGLPAAAVRAGAARLLEVSATCKTQVKVGLILPAAPLRLLPPFPSLSFNMPRSLSRCLEAYLNLSSCRGRRGFSQ